MPGKMLLLPRDQAARPLVVGVLSPGWMLATSLLPAIFYVCSVTTGESILFPPHGVPRVAQTPVPPLSFLLPYAPGESFSCIFPQSLVREQRFDRNRRQHALF